MTVNPVTSLSNTQGGLYSNTSTVLGKDDFLKLLITQLQNQDPLNPTDSTEYTAQLAQFSSLEQLSNINRNLEYLQLYQASINNSQAVSFIGKEITALGNDITVKDGVAGTCEFNLSGNANEVVISIYDVNGDLVQDIAAGSMNAGRQTVSWDGNDQQGNPVQDGNYTFSVLAEDEAGKSVQTITYQSGIVDGITFEDGMTYFILQGKKIPIAEVIEVMNVDSPEASTELSSNQQTP